MTMVVNWGRIPPRPADPAADLRAIRRDTERIRADTEQIRQRVEEVLRTQQALLQRMDRLATLERPTPTPAGPARGVLPPHESRFRALEFPPAQEGP